MKIDAITKENIQTIKNPTKYLFPESLKEIYDFQNEPRPINQNVSSMMNLYSDGTLQVLTSNQNLNFQVVFKDMFPYSLSSLEFDATNQDLEYFTAEVSFKYTMYNILDKKGNKL